MNDSIKKCSDPIYCQTCGKAFERVKVWFDTCNKPVFECHDCYKKGLINEAKEKIMNYAYSTVGNFGKLVPKACFIDKNGVFHDCSNFEIHQEHDQYMTSIGANPLTWEKEMNTIKYSSSVSTWVRGYETPMTRKQCNTLMDVLIECEANRLPEYVGLKEIHPYLENWAFNSLTLLPQLRKNNVEGLNAIALRTKFYNTLKF